MRVATWNVNGLRSRLEFVKLWLDERKPDVVALQELKLEEEKFPREALEALGYSAAVYGQKAWNGVAILARQEPKILQKGLPGQDEFGARLITAEVAGLEVTSLYCPNGKSIDHEDFPRKLAWFESLGDHLEASRTAHRPSVVTGDFNICPGELDTWNEAGKIGKLFHTAEERRRFDQILKLGFRDVYRELHPDRQEFSWWDYRAGSFHKNQGLRIDFLLASEEAGTAMDVAIDRDFRKKKEGLIPSDHAPVWVDLK